MRAIASRASRGWLGAPGIVLLLVVAVALGMLHTALPLHLHHGATPGAYNEEHVLAALDSAAGGASVERGASARPAPALLRSSRLTPPSS